MKSISLKFVVLAIVFLFVQISEAEEGCVKMGATIEETKNAFNSDGNANIVLDTTWGDHSEHTSIVFSKACNYDYPVKFEKTICYFHNGKLKFIRMLKESYADLQDAVEDAKNMEKYIDNHVKLPVYGQPGAETEKCAYITTWWIFDSPVTLQIVVFKDKSLMYSYDDTRF